MLGPSCVSGLQGSDTVLALLSSDGSASMLSKDGVFLTVDSIVRHKRHSAQPPAREPDIVRARKPVARNFNKKPVGPYRDKSALWAKKKQ